MSLFDTFDPDSEEIIKPVLQRSFSRTDNFPETVIMTFKEQTFDALNRVCPAEQVSTLRGGRAIPVYALGWHGRSIGIVHSLMGGAGTVCLLENVLARGAKKVLVYGNCGVLDKTFAAGCFILPTAAYRDEGTSYHYLPVSDYVDIPSHRRLAEIFGTLGLPFVLGKVWTTDGFYRETRGNMEKRKADGCIAIDMECASVMAAAQFRGAEVYQFLYAEDSLDGGVWDPRTMGAMPDSDHEKYLRVALETASRL
ncbi:MAG: nucleoside phosphorylase [Oscillospiraceae bacterium]|nr:nucleoside phosphorylase [Oscillospiraceae bacterium]